MSVEVKHHPSIPGFFQGTFEVTGSEEFRVDGVGGSQYVQNVMISHAASSAADANKLAKATWVRSERDPSVFTVYLWKHTSTSNPTLIAATDAVNLSISVLCDRTFV